MRPLASTSATSPSRLASSSRWTSSRSSGAPSSASISHGAPALEADPQPVHRASGDEQRLGRGDVPSVRSGSGLVNTSSVGRLGRCDASPRGLECPPVQSHVRAAARRSDRCPGRRSAASPARRAEPVGRRPRPARLSAARQAAGGSSSSKPADVGDLGPELVSAASGRRARDARAWPTRALGPGTIVQLSARSAITSIASRSATVSRPIRAGSTASSKPGRDRTAEADQRALQLGQL